MKNSDSTDSDLLMARNLDNTVKNQFPEGVSLLRKVEGGLVYDLHREIRLSINPHVIAKSEELTSYLWACGRSVTLEQGGGITIRNRNGQEKHVVGRKLFREAEIKYRMLHKMIAEALGFGQ